MDLGTALVVAALILVGGPFAIVLIACLLWVIVITVIYSVAVMFDRIDTITRYFGKGTFLSRKTNRQKKKIIGRFT